MLRTRRRWQHDASAVLVEENDLMPNWHNDRRSRCRGRGRNRNDRSRRSDHWGRRRGHRRRCRSNRSGCWRLGRSVPSVQPVPQLTQEPEDDREEQTQEENAQQELEEVPKPVGGPFEPAPILLCERLVHRRVELLVLLLHGGDLPFEVREHLATFRALARLHDAVGAIRFVAERTILVGPHDRAAHERLEDETIRVVEVVEHRDGVSELNGVQTELGLHGRGHLALLHDRVLVQLGLGRRCVRSPLSQSVRRSTEGEDDDEHGQQILAHL